jgi:hypothetical protein
MRQGAFERLAQAWLVPRWITTLRFELDFESSSTSVSRLR